MSILQKLQIIFMVYFTFNLFSTITTTKTKPEEVFSENRSLNPLLDDICKNLKNNAKEIGLEPLKLPDLIEAFNQSFWIIGTVVEIYNLSNGSLYNLESLHRYGDASISYYNHSLELEVEVEVDNIKMQYLLETSFNGHELIGTLHGDIKMLRIRVAAAIEAISLNITLKDISFPHPGKLDLSIETSKILGWLINSVLKIVTTLFESTIINQVQAVIKQTIEDYLKHFPPKT